MAQTQTPFEILGVGIDAGDDEIRKAWIKRSFENHPDHREDKSVAGEKAAAHKAADINLAYAQIKTKEQRFLYGAGISGEERHAALEDAIDLAFRNPSGNVELTSELGRLIEKYNLKDEELAEGVGRRVVESRQREEARQAQLERARQRAEEPLPTGRFADLLRSLRNQESIKANSSAMATHIKQNPSQSLRVLQMLGPDFFTRANSQVLSLQLLASSPEDFITEVMTSLIEALNERKRVKPCAEMLGQIIVERPSEASKILQRVRLNVVITPPAEALHESLWRHHRRDYSTKVLPVILVAAGQSNNFEQLCKILTQIVRNDPSTSAVVLNSLSTELLDQKEAYSLDRDLFAQRPVEFAGKMQSYFVGRLEGLRAVARASSWLNEFAKLGLDRAQAIFDAVPFRVLMDERAAVLRATLASALPNEFGDKMWPILISAINAGENLSVVFPTLASFLERQPTRLVSLLNEVSPRALAQPEATGIATKLFATIPAMFTLSVGPIFVLDFNAGKNIGHCSYWLSRLVERDASMSSILLQELNASRLSLGEADPLDQMLLLRHPGEFADKMLSLLVATLNSNPSAEKTCHLLGRVIDLKPETAREVIDKASASVLRSEHTGELRQRLETLLPIAYSEKISPWYLKLMRTVKVVIFGRPPAIDRPLLKMPSFRGESNDHS